ncbi:MAG: hypothetical protein JWO46_1752 [Nocardioidaceae bacterium]|nr:hypothetical protein [Nocardioidaceae bacterium]
MDQPRGIFFDEAHALAAVGRLRRDGYDATLAREPFAGEDDDEDHPWTVTSDAPTSMLELLVDEYDGWLDVPEPPRRPPLELPTAPLRIKYPPATP